MVNNSQSIDIAKKLISIDSSTHGSNLYIIDYIQPILEANLIAKKGQGVGGFGIFCHSDCVPPGDEAWGLLHRELKMEG